MQLRSLQRPAVALVSAVVLAACGGPSGTQAPAGPVAGGSTVSLSMATGGTGGAYFPYGGAMATLIGANIANAQVTVESTGASVENLRLLDRGQVHIALVQADALTQAHDGVNDFDGAPVEVRSLIAMYPNWMQLATTADSGLTTFDDMAGARVSVGDAGSGGELSLRGLTEILGGSFDDFGDVMQFGFNDATTAFRNNQIDVGNYHGALGLSALEELSSTTDITILSFSDEQMGTIVEAMPYWSVGTIPANTYPGLTEPVQVPVMWNFVVVSADLDRQLAHEITRAVYEHNDVMQGGHPEARHTVLDNVTRANVPYHPGAIDYFEEQGVELPDELYPDEWER